MFNLRLDLIQSLLFSITIMCNTFNVIIIIIIIIMFIAEIESLH